MSDRAVVVLVYSEGCPHVGAARANLRAALRRAGRPPRWREQRSDASDAPEWARRLGSPTVLVDGRDVAEAAGGGGCCRVYRDARGDRIEAPPVERIVAALSPAS